MYTSLSNVTLAVLACTLLSSGCNRATPASALGGNAAEELTCRDSSMAYAKYARARSPAYIDRTAGLALVVLSGVPPRGVPVDNIFLSGDISGVGGPGDPSGTTVYLDREPGLYALKLTQPGGNRMSYAATLRAGYLDTVIVTLDRRCTLVWRGGM